LDSLGAATSDMQQATCDLRPAIWVARTNFVCQWYRGQGEVEEVPKVGKVPKNK